MYLDRINAIDKKGPAINAVIEINHDDLAVIAVNYPYQWT